jgi:hypothetical protein
MTFWPGVNALHPHNATRAKRLEMMGHWRKRDRSPRLRWQRKTPRWSGRDHGGRRPAVSQHMWGLGAVVRSRCALTSQGRRGPDKWVVR